MNGFLSIFQEETRLDCWMIINIGYPFFFQIRILKRSLWDQMFVPVFILVLGITLGILLHAIHQLI